jgi:hypothetical protein
MSRVRGFLIRVGVLFRRRTLELEMSDELRAHFDGLVDRNISEGMSPEEARHAALRPARRAAKIDSMVALRAE